ncbi:MAG: hypothetical protein KTR31_20235 [Myxococcales bacterium]|nr:hypothetical protein [Myxococcales bacterium]
MTNRAWAVALALVMGCEGPEGPVGPRGPTGDDGVDGLDGMGGPPGEDGENGADALVNEVSGTVSTASGAVGANVPVFLIGVDDAGATIGQFGGTLTDASGDFSISVDDGVIPTARVVVQTEAEGVTLRASVSAGSGLGVDPVSTGVLAVVQLITETEGGRTLDDFSATQMADLYTQADAALTLNGTDLSSPGEVFRDTLLAIGGLAADYSGGGVVTGPWTVDPPADVGVPVAFQVNLVAGDGAVYDIQPDGELDDGRSPSGQLDACDDCARLAIDGVTFAPGGGLLEDGSEVALEPQNLSGLRVGRKVQADPDGPFLRYTEILRNPGKTDIEVDVSLAYDLGADADATVVDTDTGGKAPTAKDRWVLLDDADPKGGKPVVGIWTGDADAAVWNPDPAVTTEQWTVTYSAVLVPAGDTVTLVHLMAIFDDPADASLSDVLDDAGSRSGLFEGMTQAQVDANISGLQTPTFTITGEAGAVAPFAEVSATNQATSATVEGVAASDGSFALDLVGAAGDTVDLLANDGTNDSLTL